MTTPTDPTDPADVLAALEFLSTYEKDPPEVMKDDYAYDRLLAFVHDVAARALIAATEQRARGQGSEACATGHNWWPAIGCTRCDARELTGRPKPATPPTPSEPVGR